MMKMVKIEGRNPVIEALKGKRKIEKILIQEGIKGQKIDEIIKAAQEKGIRIQRVSRTKLDHIGVSHSHQGIIAFAEKKELVTALDIVAYAQERGESPFIVILDQIQDPQNFGAIIRTAYAAGAHGVIYQDKRAAGITPVVVKSSAGAIEHILLAEVKNINQTIEELKKAGLWIVGADMAGETLYYNADFKGPIGLVIGSEGKGLRRLVKENCDFLVQIPMPGEFSSLNASVAAAILIYEVLRQRQ